MMRFKAYGWGSTQVPVEGTWIDAKGHTRAARLDKKGYYQVLCRKREEQRKAALNKHIDWLMASGFPHTS